MGNYKFRLSDMIPNAWFYKLKDMGKARNTSKKKHPIPSSSTIFQATQPQASSKPKQPHNSYYPRKSYYFTRELTSNDKFYNSPTKDSDTHFPKDTPRKSLKNRARRRTITMRSYPSPKLVSSTVSSGCNCRTTKSHEPQTGFSSSSSTFDSSSEPELLHENEMPQPENEFRSDNVLPTESSFDEMLSLSSSCASKVISSSDKDIIINVDKNSLSRQDDKAGGFDTLSDYELPPIITKPANLHDEIKDVKKKKKKKENTKESLFVKEKATVTKENKSSPLRRLSVSSPGVRLRISSPKIASRKIQQAYSRKSISSSSSKRIVSESFAIVKASFDPQRDFRESMMEMIVENNIRGSKDLEELLACYLSLNSDEYHDLIIKVFKQIWFDLIDSNSRLK